ncbi:hypothetical protein WJX72_009681 [[Myrmecia] bisecta]|uniref:TFIIS N-terminal domain-containing protein n=1 Tax=[Myrmecia] bisecta TaxID=41462 RepID=A0AAW1QB29_9CHLO
MEKFLTKQQGPTARKASPKRKGAQRTLRDCAKVVVLEVGVSAVNCTQEDISKTQQALQRDSSSDKELLAALRRLSVFHLTKQLLMETQVGRDVRKLKKHANAEVARIASNLVEKWVNLVQEQRPCKQTAQSASQRLPPTWMQSVAQPTKKQRTL